MSEARDATPTHDPDALRLRSCPACEYSIDALPPEGVCPECGQSYDQRFIVLTGQGRGGYDTLVGGTWRGATTHAGALLFVLWTAPWIRAVDAMWYVAWGFAAAGPMCLELYARLFSDREPRMQLWLSSEGAAQISSTTEARWAMQAQSWASWLFIPVIILATIPSSRSTLLIVGLFVVVTFALGAVIALPRRFVAHRRQVAELSVHRPEVTFGLWPWASIDTSTVRPLSKGRARVRMETTLKWRRLKLAKRRVVDIEVELTAAQRDALQRRFDQWMPMTKPHKEINAMSETSSLPKAGEKAPAFTLPSSTGETVDLAKLKGRRVVLYFYPRADTPGCTKQACGFRDAIASYKHLDVPVFGISPDPVDDVKKFAEKFQLNFPLLADADHAVAERYGVWAEKSMYGKKYKGVNRTTFIIDADGKVAHVLEKVKPEGHDQEVLKLLNAGE